MTIDDLRQYRNPPFEIEDEQLRKVFAFFLHKAPTIDSLHSLNIESSQLQINWEHFLSEWKHAHRFYSRDYFPNDDVILDFVLSDGSEVKRNCQAFICTKADKNEQDYECLLRHIRNAIAHGHLFVDAYAKRKYILFEDCNSNGNLRALILLTLTDMKNLKMLISRSK